MSNGVIDEEAAEQHHLPVFDAHSAFAWWEGNRWIFNLAVGLSGLVVIAFHADRWRIDDTFGIALYGFFANLFYLLGFWVEMIDQHSLKGVLRLWKFRLAIFLIGTVGSMLLTGLATWLFYSMKQGPIWP